MIKKLTVNERALIERFKEMKSPNHSFTNAKFTFKVILLLATIISPYNKFKQNYNRKAKRGLNIIFIQ